MSLVPEERVTLGTKFHEDNLGTGGCVGTVRTGPFCRFSSGQEEPLEREPAGMLTEHRGL